MANWYYLRDGEQRGPVSKQQLRQWAATGTLTAQDLVWCDGMAEWQPLSAIAEEHPPLAQPTGRSGSTSSGPQRSISATAPSATTRPEYKVSDPAATSLGYATPVSTTVAPHEAGGTRSISLRSFHMIRMACPYMQAVSIILYLMTGFTLLASAVILLSAVFYIAVTDRFTLLGDDHPPLYVSVIQSVILVGVAALYFFPAKFLWTAQAMLVKFHKGERPEDLEAGLRAQGKFWKFTATTLITAISIYLFITIITLAFRSEAK